MQWNKASLWHFESSTRTNLWILWSRTVLIILNDLQRNVRESHKIGPLPYNICFWIQLFYNFILWCLIFIILNADVLYFNSFLKKNKLGTSLEIQWLRCRASTVGGAGSIPDGGGKIPHAMRRSFKKKKKEVFKQARGTGMPGRMEVWGFGWWKPTKCFTVRKNEALFIRALNSDKILFFKWGVAINDFEENLLYRF